MHRLHIPAMACSACVAPIRRALMSVDPAMRAQFMPDQRRISLETPALRAARASELQQPAAVDGEKD